MKKQNRARVLRELLTSKDKILVTPCCYDGLSATLIEQAGFSATFVSGASLTNALTGTSDIGVLSYGEYRMILQYILHSVSFPVMVDVDTGYGGTLPILRMVEEYEEMGVAGIQIEDQIFPKRCAYFGATVVSDKEMCARIHSAVKARFDHDFLIIARTDCAKSLGFKEAIRRAILYYEAGADMIFISTPSSQEDMAQLTELNVPKCTSVVEGTVTESYTPEDFFNMGFSLVKYPQTLIRATIKVQWDILKQLQCSGLSPSIMLTSQEERARLTNLKKYTDFEDDIEKKTNRPSIATSD